jgi:transposase InsO family protein
MFPLKNLFETETVVELEHRIGRLRPDSERLWGKMTAAQAVAHCAVSMEWAVGDKRPPRLFVGRLLGRIVKPRVFANDEPMRRNSPTTKDLLIHDDRSLESETARLRQLIDRFAKGGPAGCTTHPHSFFGPLTPVEWSALMYKHLDHHLRQFGV